MTNANLYLKRSIKSVAGILKTRMPAKAHRRGEVNILAYHRVVADISKAENESYYGLVISAATFRRHCELLSKKYRIVSLESVGTILRNRSWSNKPLAAITFDDGYRDFYEEAFPILQEFGFTATVFLPTECIGQDVPLAHDRLYWLLKMAGEKRVKIVKSLERAGVSAQTAGIFSRPSTYPVHTERLVHLPVAVREKVIIELESLLPDLNGYPREFSLLNWEQVREMSAAGITFGGHTANHVVLPLEPGSSASSEIVRCKRELEEQLGCDVTTFAYPNGELNRGIRDQVARAGYKVAVTTERKRNRRGTDPLALGRFSLCEESTRGISGTYSPEIAALRFGQ